MDELALILGYAVMGLGAVITVMWGGLKAGKYILRLTGYYKMFVDTLMRIAVEKARKK